MTSPVFATRAERLARIEAVAAERILVLDGAMGSMIQQFPLEEADFRGERFAHHDHPLKGNNDLLVLTKPEVIEDIHTRFAAAGAELISTNTFSSTSISQADYGLESAVYDLNKAAAELARKVCLAFETVEKPRGVVGAMGPTNRTLSLSPDVNDPGFRAVTFDQMVETYTEQANGLLDGGVDFLLVETVFDTLVAKAALYAIEAVFDARGERVPVMISGTITDRSGRTLSGQTVEAFWNSLAHVKPWSIGLNCALGPKEMRPFLAELSRVATCKVSVYPNAGLPNAFGGYDETPEDM
ncbi:MAG: homocysteine S-methyltransferase family protein, partial [Hyphomonadaceae bacterium]|nr:homocysteine S-methyltransferase family protein [Hyphomonadaceae bacterium]